VEKKTESKKASVESKESNAGKDSKRLEKEKLAEGKISQKISTKSDDKIVKVSEMKLAFSVDKETDRVIVKVLDAESGEEIRQIPSDEVVAIARRLEQSKGRILDHTV
jgi:flagellar protein FlaG